MTLFEHILVTTDRQLSLISLMWFQEATKCLFHFDWIQSHKKLRVTILL